MLRNTGNSVRKTPAANLPWLSDTYDAGKDFIPGSVGPRSANPQPMGNQKHRLPHPGIEVARYKNIQRATRDRLVSSRSSGTIVTCATL